MRSAAVVTLALTLALLCGCAANAQYTCDTSTCNALCRNVGYVRGSCETEVCHCSYQNENTNSGWNPWDTPDGGDECGGCPERQLCCDGVCMAVENDLYNCGICGRQCADGESCVNGWCLCGGTSGCLTDSEKCCGGTCVNLLYDPTNCGDCGVACQPDTGPECWEGECVCPDLTDSPVACDGTRADLCCERTFLAAGGCFDLDMDREHCGTCDLSCPIFEGSICLFGSCTTSGSGQ